MQNMVNIATLIATLAHEGQVDKAGNDYIEHPLYVASLVVGEEEKVVALLHDVIEDAKVTSHDLEKAGFTREIVEAIEVMTKTPRMTYEEYLKRIKGNALATVVKLADLKHNSDISRIENPTEKDYRRCQKYNRAISYLTE